MEALCSYVLWSDTSPICSNLLIHKLLHKHLHSLYPITLNTDLELILDKPY